MKSSSSLHPASMIPLTDVIHLHLFSSNMATLETLCPSLQQHASSSTLDYMRAHQLDADKQRARRLSREKERLARGEQRRIGQTGTNDECNEIS